MSYQVRVDSIAEDVTDEVKNSIINFLQSYDFPYVTTVTDKQALRAVFTEHFRDRHNLEWLKERIDSIRSSSDRRGIAAVAWTETSRVHTAGLGKLLLSKGQTKCRTAHSYGHEKMSQVCQHHLENKILDIDEIIKNSFPSTREGIMRTDIPMIPQHVNCRHVMAPLE